MLYGELGKFPDASRPADTDEEPDELDSNDDSTSIESWPIGISCDNTLPPLCQPAGDAVETKWGSYRLYVTVDLDEPIGVIAARFNLHPSGAISKDQGFDLTDADGPLEVHLTHYNIQSE